MFVMCIMVFWIDGLNHIQWLDNSLIAISWNSGLAIQRDDIHFRKTLLPWASYQIRKIAGCACTGYAGNVFPATDLEGNQLLAIPGCITAFAPQHGKVNTSIIKCGMKLLIHYQRWNRWRIGIDLKFHPTLYWACNYIFVLGIKSTHVSKLGHWCSAANYPTT